MAALLLIAFAATGPAAVQWHQHVIADENVSWMPPLPDLQAVYYVLKLAGLICAATVIDQFAAITAHDLMLFILGSITSSENEQFAEFFVSALSTILFFSILLLLFGTWMLHLPEGAFDSHGLSVRNDWQPGARRDYLLALGVIFLFPAIFSLGLQNIWAADIDLVTQLVGLAVGIGVCVFGAALGLSLLTVVYKEKLDRAGMTFGRKIKVA